MMARARVAGLTLLALAVPTFAFGGEQAPSGPANLSVTGTASAPGGSPVPLQFPQAPAVTVRLRTSGNSTHALKRCGDHCEAVSDL